MNNRLLKPCTVLACIVFATVGCGKHSDRNVYGNASDDRFLSRCTTGGGIILALYINTSGGVAVGTSFSVTAEHTPEFEERQIMYSEIPAILSLKCAFSGFDVITTLGSVHFTEAEVEALRAKPRELDEQFKHMQNASSLSLRPVLTSGLIGSSRPRAAGHDRQLTARSGQR